MSMHASEGLTADLVVLAGLVDGFMPRVDAAEPPTPFLGELGVELPEAVRGED